MCTHHDKYNINVANMTRDLPGDNIRDNTGVYTRSRYRYQRIIIVDVISAKTWRHCRAPVQQKFLLFV